MGMDGGQQLDRSRSCSRHGASRSTARRWSPTSITSAARAQGRQPAVLALTEKAVNKDDIVTADANNLFFVFGGAFTGTPAEGLTADGADASRRRTRSSSIR